MASSHNTSATQVDHCCVLFKFKDIFCVFTSLFVVNINFNLNRHRTSWRMYMFAMQTVSMCYYFWNPFLYTFI